MSCNLNASSFRIALETILYMFDSRRRFVTVKQPVCLDPFVLDLNDFYQLEAYQAAPADSLNGKKFCGK